jgi:predicted anti-sigma-YlaC factor YlaD
MNEAKHIDVSAALAAGMSDVEEAHLAGCAACRARRDSAQAEMAALRGIDAPLAKVPESFWEDQRRSIRVRAAEARPQRVRMAGVAWVAGAAAVLVVSAGLLLPQNDDKGAPLPHAQQQPVEEVSDAAFIRSVQDDLEAYPEALHPAQVMYVEMSSASTATARGNKR